MCASMLAALGGGGGHGTPGPLSRAITPFALSHGSRARIGSRATEHFSHSDSRNGRAPTATDPYIASSFEGDAAYPSAQFSTIRFTNSLRARNAAADTTYSNASYVPIGQPIVGGGYSKFESPPPDPPAAVKVGGRAVVATLDLH